MTRFGSLEKAVTDRKVLDAYEAYLASERDMNKEAELLQWILTKNGERIRTGSWSASSAGRCLREQQFTYLGVKGRKPGDKALNIFSNGDYVHLRYQVAGMAGGWLSDVEVPLTLGGTVRGTADGILAWDEVLEIKSINARGFAEVCDYGPKSEHKYQATAYMMATGLSKTRFIYENKNTQDNVEFIFDLTREYVQKVTLDWDTLNGATEQRKLLPMRQDCQEKTGFAYRYCKFADTCAGQRFPGRLVLDADA